METFHARYISGFSDTYCIVPATTYYQIIAWLVEHRTAEFACHRRGTIFRVLPSGEEQLAGYIADGACILIAKTMMEFGCPVAIAPNERNQLKAAIAALTTAQQ